MELDAWKKSEFRKGTGLGRGEKDKKRVELSAGPGKTPTPGGSRLGLYLRKIEIMHACGGSRAKVAGAGLGEGELERGGGPLEGGGSLEGAAP